MENEQDITDAFLKQLKTGDQLNSFFSTAPEKRY
jgi:hypothetical protein